MSAESTDCHPFHIGISATNAPAILSRYALAHGVACVTRTPNSCPPLRKSPALLQVITTPASLSSPTLICRGSRPGLRWGRWGIVWHCRSPHPLWQEGINVITMIIVIRPSLIRQREQYTSVPLTHPTT